MGLFDKLFPHKTRQPTEKQVNAYFKALTAYQPVYTSYEGGLYEMALTRTAIATFARHASKLHLEIVGDARHDLAYTLAHQPNPWQTSSAFLARLATIYEVQNNAFIVPIEDKMGRLVGYYPVLPQQAEIVEVGGAPYLRYRFMGGQTASIEFERAGLLVQHQYEHDFFGSSNRPLLPVMEVAHTQDQGIINGIKNATTIRFLARLAGVYRPEDINKERESFAKSNLSANDTGVMMFDNKYSDVKQIESLANVVNPRQQEYIRDSVYEYFGTNEKILTNTYTEAEWDAYYEGKVEPFAIQASQVLSRMTFNACQLDAGAMILATTNRLQYASNQTKLEVVTQLFDRGFLTHNQGLEIFNLSPIDGGDKYFIRREYTEIDKLADKQHPIPLDAGEGDTNGNDTGNA